MYSVLSDRTKGKFNIKQLFNLSLSKKADASKEFHWVHLSLVRKKKNFSKFCSLPPISTPLSAFLVLQGTHQVEEITPDLADDSRKGSPEEFLHTCWPAAVHWVIFYVIHPLGSSQQKEGVCENANIYELRTCSTAAMLREAQR